MLPEFNEPRPLPDGRSWTAELESIDRHDDGFWVVTVRREGAVSCSLMARVSTLGPDEWIERRLASVAESEESNTDYAGIGGGRVTGGAQGTP